MLHESCQAPASQRLLPGLLLSPLPRRLRGPRHDACRGLLLSKQKQHRCPELVLCQRLCCRPCGCSQAARLLLPLLLPA